MHRFFSAFLWASLSVLLMVNVASGQTVSIREINPTNIGAQSSTGGRVNHLGRATDSIFYAASEFGGLYKSIDAGHTWVRLDTYLPTKVLDVKVSPADPNLVIATSIYDGRVSSLAGISVSNNGGATWTKPASAKPPSSTFCASSTSFIEPSAYGIAFDPENAAHIFVGTNCGLARSTDGGLNWTFINPGPGSRAADVFGVVVHHGGLIDTCGDGHRRSIDGGGTWDGPQAGGIPLPSGVCSIAASPDESYVLFATAGTKIFETDNGGSSWDTEFVNPKQQGRVTFVVTHQRVGPGFDLWFGDVGLYRTGCTTPTIHRPGSRCPPSDTWTRVNTGAHSDMGEVVFTKPPPINVTACRQGCTNAKADCDQGCQSTHNDCLASGGLASQCNHALSVCSSNCTTDLNACNSNCSRPQEGCPVILASDGGTYINTITQSPACQTPVWIQSDVTTRALWLWSLGGGNIPNSPSREGLYMGAQDNGIFATLNAGAATPDWINPYGADVSDTVSDSAQVVYTQCCFFMGRGNRVIRRNPGVIGGDEIPTYPPGDVPWGLFPDDIARFGLNGYAMISTSGIFVTQNITDNPINWTMLGTNPPIDSVGLWAAGPPTNPTFFTLSFQGTIMRYLGTSATGTWQQIPLPPGSDYVGVFAVDPNNPNRLFVSGVKGGVVVGANFANRLPIPPFDNNHVHMFRSANGGATWTPDPQLDGLMSGGGAFLTQTSKYDQPTLVAFDPNNSDNLLAGAADAGIFLSQNNGASWLTVTNNSGDASNPIIPRPHWAYFNRECGQYNIYVGTQGRGAWHLSYHDPAGTSVSVCQSHCETALSECKSECQSQLADCLREGGLASQCNTAASQCKTGCGTTRDACRQSCVSCPQ